MDLLKVGVLVLGHTLTALESSRELISKQLQAQTECYLYDQQLENTQHTHEKYAYLTKEDEEGWIGS